MPIVQALLKYGWPQEKIFLFVLRLVEYVDIANLSVQGETFYITHLLPYYNILKQGYSSLGYKHTEEARLKMVNHYKDKNNHPMFGKKHSDSVLSLISKPGKLNPMFGKTHNENTKNLISIKQSIRPLGLYDENNNLIEKYSNQVKLAIKFNVHKSTISRYIKSGKLFKGKFYIKEIKS